MIRCLVLDHDDTVVRSGETVNHPALMESLRIMRPDCAMTYRDFCEYCYRLNYTGMCREYLHMTDEEIEAQFDTWKVYVRTHIPEAYEGIGEVLREFRNRGGLICVSSHSGTENILRDYALHFGFAPDKIYAWELGEELRKPHPYALRDIMESFCLSPQEILMVDDMRSGRDMAQACNVPFACAGWSHISPMIAEDMRKHCPLYFTTVEEFRQYLFGDLTAMV